MHGASSIEKAILVTFSRELIGSPRQPQRRPSPVEAGFAPAGKRLEIIGAVSGTGPFPVANASATNSSETTPPRWPPENMRMMGATQSMSVFRLPAN